MLTPSENLFRLLEENAFLKLTIANQRAQLQTLNGVLAKRKVAAKKLRTMLDKVRGDLKTAEDVNRRLHATYAMKTPETV